MANFAGQATLRVSATSTPNEHNYRCQAFTLSNPGNGNGGISVSTNQPFELAAGASVTLKTTFNNQTAVSNPLTVRVAVYDDAGTNVLAQTTVYSGSFTGGAGSGTDVVFTPATAGTYEIRVFAAYGPDAIGGSYTADSSGAYTLSGTPNLWAATLSEASKGYVRTGTTITAASVSNISPGGAVPTTWTYPDRAYTALTLGVAPQVPVGIFFSESARSNTVSVSTTAANDATGLGPLDKTDLGNARTGNVVVKAIPANSTLGARPAFHFTSVPTGWTLGAVDAGSTSTGAVSITSPNLTTDIGVRVQHYMALNDNSNPPLGSVDSPPSDTKNIAHDVAARLTSDLGFVFARYTNARNEVLSGITVTRHLQDTGHLVSDIANDSATSTAHGWDSSYIVWSASLPGGAWTDQRVITAPSGLVGMEITGSQNFSILAVNPNNRLIVGLDVPSDTADANHWTPGTPLLIGITMVNFANDKQVVLDISPIPTALIGRFNVAFGRAEYLGADYAWHSLSGGTAYEFPLSQSAGDANVWIATFTSAQTAGFSYDGLIMVGKAYVNGTPYTGPAALEVTGTANKHAAYAFDGAGFLGLASYK